MTELDDARVIDVLLVEDDEGDVLITREAFEYYKIRNRLHVVGDGEQALQFLRRSGPYTDAPPRIHLSRPCVPNHWMNDIADSNDGARIGVNATTRNVPLSGMQLRVSA